MGRAAAEGGAGWRASAGPGEGDAAALRGSVAQERSHPMTLARHPVPLPGAGLRVNNKSPDWPPVTIVPPSGAGLLGNNTSSDWLRAADG